MNNINLFVYSGNLYKKTLEKFIAELKVKVNDHLENNDLNKAKELIKEIEEIRTFQREVDKVSARYTKYFKEPGMESITTKTEKNKHKVFNHYTNEIIEIIKTAEQIRLYELKVAFFNENSEHLSTDELSTNEDCNNLLNWEIYFYRTVDFLLKKELIESDKYNYFIITEKGLEFYGEDFGTEEFLEEDEFLKDDDDEENKGMIELVEMKGDFDLITSLHTYILSCLVQEGIIKEPNYFSQETLYVIKEIINMEEKRINKWDEIELDKYYLISTYSDHKFTAYLINNKIEKYQVLECIDENEDYDYLLFL